MAALAYIPTLLSSPGMMPSDTKLYLYLDPRRLVSDSIWSFDARQFGGWVPHQMIAYAWPSGPWYVVAQAIALPDWVAHRLWIGTIMFAAGAGVAWAARRLGLSLPAAVAAGLVYELSPYLVPYVSRTSSMLLPWAGLGWVVGLTIGAATRTRWRDAAICALVVGSVAGVNATALVMVAPAPVLWLVVATAERTVTSRRAIAAALRIGGLSLATSAWWAAMLAIQGRHGADLLSYSESLEDVSYTATSVEVWRSLGYWLMYIRDGYAPTTTAGADYMEAGRPLVLGFVLVVTALVGLAAVRFRARRYAIVLTFVGLVLAVGVHPFADPSPIARLVRGDGQDGLALALRSSTRALPLMTIGLGLGAGALVDVLGRRRNLVRIAAAAIVVLVAVGNNPVVTGHAFVDPALEREQYPPDAWYAASDSLDSMPDGYRVLQLPGAEFGAFTWGYTVDPPLPGLTSRPVVTRDLLPLGSPSTMDLLYALDDRFQSGRVEVDSIAPIARLLGADTIWVTGDAAFDRFRTPRPELTSALYASAGGDADLGEPIPYGRPAVNAPTVPMVDEQSLSEELVGTPVPPVELVPVLDPVPVVRVSDDVVLVSGSGDGLVDAAAAGLIEGDEAILYSASMTGDELLAAAEDAGAIIVTDSNRRRAHHWRNSQDVSGYTETGDGRAVLWNDSGDARLVVFPDADLPAYTLSRSEGEVTAVATSYGARFEYQPETRAALAIDGDPNTAWTVLDHTNQLIALRTAAGVDHVTLLQPNGLDPVRHLRNVTISVNGGSPIPVVLNDQSLVVGQQVSFPATDGPTTIRIRLDAVSSADHSGRPDRTGVGFAEIDVGLGDSPEVITVPTDLTTAMSEGGVVRPVTYVLTRERVRATNRWRADPEWRIVRVIDVPAAQDVTVGVDVRLDLRASDMVLAGLLGIEGPTASARLTGAPTAGGWAVADGDVATAWVTPFNRVNGSALNATLIAPGEPMTIRQRLGNYTRITAVMMTQGDRTVLVPIPEPNAAGESTVIAPAEFEPGPIRIEIVGTLERTTRDRRLADTVLMPAAISEITNIEPATIPDSFETECRDDLLVIDGEPVAVRVAGSLADAFDGAELDATVCDPTPLSLDAGEHRVLGQDNRRIGLQVDRIVLDAGSGAGVTGEAGPTATLTSSSRLGRDVTVDGCVEGCWLILGEGFHDAWSASTDEGSLGEPRLISGGFNGWWIPPSDGPVDVHVSWTAQRPLNAAIAMSVVAAIACVVLVVRDRRAIRGPRWTPADDVRWRPLGPNDGIRRSAVAAAAWTGLSVLFVSTDYVWWGLLGAAAILLTRRIRIAAWCAVAGMVRIAIDVITFVWREHPPAYPGFPGNWEHLHRFGLFIAVSLLVSLLAHHHHHPTKISTGQIQRER
jgi:arabinofuranan 3-O-arabinosyltransferase